MLGCRYSCVGGVAGGGLGVIVGVDTSGCAHVRVRVGVRVHVRVNVKVKCGCDCRYVSEPCILF